MPYMKRAAAKLSWDTFPEPPPEAESWQPDPDCIPVAGDFPDLRFNRHPLTEMHKMALQRDRRFELANDGLITSAGIGSPTTSTSSKTTPSGIGSWSMPLSCATGSSHAFASVPRKEARHPISAPAQTSRTVQAASPIMFPVQPPPQQLQTPILSIVLQKPDSFTNSPTPAWACPLTRLLSESSSKPVPSDRSSSVQGRSTALPSVSIPPHLRKQVRSSTPVTSHGSSSERLLNQANETVSSAMKPERSVTPVFKHTNVIGQEQVTKECETSLLQHPTGTEVKPTKLVEGFSVQKTLLESLIPKKPVSSTCQHQRYLNTKLINLMEDEMDLKRRTTRQELHDMTDTELFSHFAKTLSMHKLAWETKQRDRGCRVLSSENELLSSQ